MESKLDIKSVKCNFEIVEDEKEDGRFSKVKILVAHTGWNYNNTFFSKEILEEMANESLGKIPIVGFTTDEDGGMDFAGHEEGFKVTKNSEGEESLELVYFGVPYGFIPPNPEFNFEMVDTELGEKEYLVTYGYVWNKFEGSELFDKDKNHSMELLPDDLDGVWIDRGDGGGGWEITTATFDALCALGDNHAPAMAGSMIEKFSHKFTKKSGFKEQFEQMFNEYSKVEDKGGEQMGKNKENEFELSLEQKREMLVEKIISLETFTNEWGDTYDKYMYLDTKDDVVYFKSWEDWKDYGVKFAINAETQEIEIDMADMFEVVVEYTPLSDAFENDDDERVVFESEIGKAVNSIMKSNHEKLETEKSELEETYKTNLVEKENELNKTFETKEEEYEKTITELEEYKTKQLSKDKASFVRTVENLTDDEKQDFLDKRDEYTMEELVKNVKLFVADKVMSYSKNEDEIAISAVTNFEKEEIQDDDDAGYMQWIENNEEDNKWLIS